MAILYDFTLKKEKKKKNIKIVKLQKISPFLTKIFVYAIVENQKRERESKSKNKDNNKH